MYGSRRSSRINNNHFEENFTESSANFSDSIIDQSKNTERMTNEEGQTIQLLSLRPNGKIQVNEQALNIIASYNDRPVGFVALVGKYRTGKSFLLNKLLFLQGNGFKVESSTHACTQGIWMWTNPFLNEYLGNYLFFIDTEGLDSLQKGEENDTRIFTLATLISSYLLYNSVGCIDERSISELNSITKLSKNIMTEENMSIQQNEQRLYEFMPKFVWILRDFTLELEDDRGRKITPKQYLENCLKDDNTHVRINDDARRIKRSLLTNFRDRDCLTLVRPARQQNEIQSLNRLSDTSLRRQFIEGVNALRQKIQRNAGCKKFEGKDLFGNDMACMIEAYAQAINNGAIPNIKTAWEQIADNQGDVAFSMAHQKYLQIFEQNFDDNAPKEQKELYKLLSSMKEQAVQQFKKNSSQDNEEYYKKLRQWIKKQQQAIIQANENATSSQNLQILKDQSHDLMKKVQSNYYLGKKDQYLEDLQSVLKAYRRKAIGDKKQGLLAQFLETTNKIAINLDKQPENYQNNQYLAKEAQQKLRIQQQIAQTKSNQDMVNANMTKNDIKKKQQMKRRKSKMDKKQQKKFSCCGGKCQIM